ncbi:helix-hairpin-helix domain-containing protein [Aquimarina addita]|uniref:Helix-hairpin-helix domain-containing protein n=1 Tax=Aquimarina addita TaxID=870485 RepID=A0ABP7X996_9FLAO
MKILKSHFELHTRFRNGIFVFALLIFCLLITFYFYPNPQKEDIVGLKKLAVHQSQINCLKEEVLKNKESYEQRPFNPNFISDYKGYVLGLSTLELDKLYEFRSHGKWINSTEDFKKVTKVSDSILAKISPFFKFPDWIQKNKKSTPSFTNKYPIKSYAQKGDLNQISAELLMEEIGIPDFIAERIVQYRDKIGGFISDIQLQDISGLYEHQRTKLLALYTVKTPVKIQKININKATVKELVEIPYFDFETALEIRDFVSENQEISDFKELEKIIGVSLEKIDRIELYLKLD